jgi:RNA polymerase sigma-70 factor, ECF subfamily
MRLRKRRPNQFSLDEPIQGETELLPRELEDWEPNPEQKYADVEITTILNELMEQIDPEFRIVLVLRDVEELSTQETAEALGISKSAVKSRLLRGRLKLRDKLNRYFRKGALN